MVPGHHTLLVPFLGVRMDSAPHENLVPSSSAYPHGYGREASAQPVKDVESQETGHRGEVFFWKRNSTLG